MAKTPKRPNLKPPGRCIFCGGPGLSKQHVWPEWLKSVNPITGDYHNIAVSTIKYYEPEPSSLSHDGWRQEGEAGSRKIRNVCTSCNNGWISQVERAAKPTVIPLMRDEWVFVTREEQRRLASWLAIVTVMSEFLDPRLKAIPPLDTTHIRGTREPPPEWQVWLARYRGTNWDDHVCRRKALVIGDNQNLKVAPSARRTHKRLRSSSVSFALTSLAPPIGRPSPATEKELCNPFGRFVATTFSGQACRQSPTTKFCRLSRLCPEASPPPTRGPNGSELLSGAPSFGSPETVRPQRRIDVDSVTGVVSVGGHAIGTRTITSAEHVQRSR